MRSRSGFSVALMVVTLCGVGWLSLSHPANSEDKKPDSPELKQLQKKRLAILEQLHAIELKSYQSGTSDFESVTASAMDLLTARIEYAEARDARMKAYNEAIEAARQWHSTLQRRTEIGQTTRIAVLKAEAFVLKLEIAREQAASEQ